MAATLRLVTFLDSPTHVCYSASYHSDLLSLFASSADKSIDSICEPRYHGRFISCHWILDSRSCYYCIRWLGGKANLMSLMSDAEIN